MRHRFLPGCKILLGILLSVGMQCALSGSIVDRGRFETKLTAMRLQNHPTLKVYHGGSRRDIPLTQINTIIIDPSNMTTIDNELCFSADITLKDGSRIKSIENDQSTSNKVYLAVQDALVGRKDKDWFIIRLEDVARISVY